MHRQPHIGYVSSPSSGGRQAMKGEDTPSYAQVLAKDGDHQADIDGTGNGLHLSGECKTVGKVTFRRRRLLTPERRPARRETTVQEPCTDERPPTSLDSSDFDTPLSPCDSRLDTTKSGMGGLLPSPLPAINNLEKTEVTRTSASTQIAFFPLYNKSASIDPTTSPAQPDTTAVGITLSSSRIPPGDWRHHQAMELDDSTSNRYRTSDLKTRDHGVPFSNQQPGAIFCHFDFRYVDDPSVTVEDPHIVETSNGRLAYKNEHFFAVADSDEETQTVAETPLYTYGNKGLAGKPYETWYQHMSVMPKGTDPSSFTNQVPWNPVLKIQEGDVLDRSTIVVKYYEIFERSMDCNELKWVRQLDDYSTQTLRDYVNRAFTGPDSTSTIAHQRFGDGLWVDGGR